MRKITKGQKTVPFRLRLREAGAQREKSQKDRKPPPLGLGLGLGRPEARKPESWNPAFPEHSVNLEEY